MFDVADVPLISRAREIRKNDRARVKKVTWVPIKAIS